MTAHRFKFAWSRTSPDRPYDFVAADGDLRVGRVYKLAGVDECWKWAMNAWIGNRLGTASGIVGSRDEACEAVEREYEAMKAAIGDRE